MTINYNFVDIEGRAEDRADARHHGRHTQCARCRNGKRDTGYGLRCGLVLQCDPHSNPFGRKQLSKARSLAATSVE